jgi:alkylation response protein AidB-like acyl-CoA dehydrogenase
MDFSFSEEQQAVRDLAGQIFADHADPERLRKLETSAEGIDRELWSALARANLLGIPLPADHDGSDLGLIATSLLLEEQGRNLCPVPLLATLVLGAMPIAEFGSDRQKQRWLPGVVSGEILLSAALTEAAAWDPAQPRVTATSDGPDWRLEGEKICVPAGALAERILVPARTGANSVGVFLLDPSSDAVEIEPERTTNHESQARLVLSGARVCADDVLGDPAGGSAIVAWIEARALLGLCAIQVGVAAEALRRTAEYTGIRKQFGRQIGAFQGVSLRAADAYIDVEAMRATLLQAAWRLDDGRPAEVEVHAAKWWACRGGQRVVHTAQHLHGGMGADIDYPIHRYLLWSKQLDLTLGGAAPQLARLGRLVALGEEAGASSVEASGK